MLLAAASISLAVTRMQYWCWFLQVIALPCCIQCINSRPWYGAQEAGRHLRSAAALLPQQEWCENGCHGEFWSLIAMRQTVENSQSLQTKDQPAFAKQSKTLVVIWYMQSALHLPVVFWDSTVHILLLAGDLQDISAPWFNLRDQWYQWPGTIAGNCTISSCHSCWQIALILYILQMNISSSIRDVAYSMHK